MNGEELKTLKDLEREDKVYSMDTLEFKRKDSIVYMSDLRQEAVKWIKEFSEPDHEFVKDHSLTIDGIRFGNYEELEKVKNWIKHFFNITDEELK